MNGWCKNWFNWSYIVRIWLVVPGWLELILRGWSKHQVGGGMSKMVQVVNLGVVTILLFKFDQYVQASQCRWVRVLLLTFYQCVQEINQVGGVKTGPTVHF